MAWAGGDTVIPGRRAGEVRYVRKRAQAEMVKFYEETDTIP